MPQNRIHQEHICETAAKNTYLGSNQQKTLDTSKLRDILQNEWLTTFKTVNSMKIKKD